MQTNYSYFCLLRGRSDGNTVYPPGEDKISLLLPFPCRGRGVEKKGRHLVIAACLDQVQGALLTMQEVAC